MEFDKLVSHYFPRTALSVLVITICAILYLPSMLFVVLSVEVLIYVSASILKCTLIPDLVKRHLWFVVLFGVITMVQLAADIAAVGFLLINFSNHYPSGYKAGFLFGASVASCMGLFLFDIWFTICVFIVIRRVREGNEQFV